MKLFRIIGLFVVLVSFVYKCSAQDTALERRALDYCSNLDSLVESYYFKGYTIEEVKGTLIKEFKEGMLIDSFYIGSDYIRSYREKDSLNLRFCGVFKASNLHVHNQYHFCVPGYPPRILSNMKIGPHYVRNNYYSCDLYEFQIDGVVKEGSSIEVIKNNTGE